MALRVVTPPTGGLITLDEAKAQLRLDSSFTDDDALVSALILAATRAIENRTQRRYLAQTLEWVREDWDNPMILPVAPALDSSKAAITWVKYVDLDGTLQTLDPSVYYWDRPYGATRSIVRKWYVIWPWLGDGAERVVIRFGITSTAADVPDDVKHACKLLVSHYYQNRDAVVGVENRDSSTPLPLGVADLLLNGETWS